VAHSEWAVFGAISGVKANGFLVLVGEEDLQLKKWDIKTLDGKVQMIRKDSESILMIAKTNGL
jgi:hypothetical protein